MTRTVFCQKHQQTLEGLNAPPFPGPKGETIFNNVSKQAWQEWQAHQTRLINEKQLSMMNAEHRQYLQDQQQRFLSSQAFDQAEGYVPTAANSHD